MHKNQLNYEPLPLFLIIFWVSLISGLWVFDTLNQYALPTTDIGQWIMYSRFYSGESVPLYRVPLGVSPFLPLTIAVFGNSISSAIIVASVLHFLLTFVASYIANELDDEISGLVTCFLFGFGQCFIVYLISFGGLPQLAAIVTMCLGYFGLARYGNRGSVSLIVTSCILLAFFHFPSAPFYFVTIAISLLFLEQSKCTSAIEVIAKIGKYLFIPISAWALFLIIFFDQEITYATNSAGFFRHGIEHLIHLWLGLLNNKWVFFMVLTGVFSIIILPFLYLNKKSRKFYRSSILVLIWFLIPAGSILASYLLQLGTIYSRFQFYLVPPLLFSLAFLLNHFLRKVIEIFYVYPEFSLDLRGWLKKLLFVAVTIVIVMIIINNFIFTLHFFPLSVDYYSLDKDKSFLDLISWIQSSVSEKSTLSPFLEAMWIEGLTGQSTIFPNKFRNLYKPGEADRSLVASILSTGSTITIENGYIFLRSQNAKANTLFNPNIAMYRRGEYVSVFNIQDQLITIDISREGKKEELNLEADFRVASPAIINNRKQIQIVCDYFWNLDEDELKVRKIVSVSKNLPEVSLIFEITMKAHSIFLDLINIQLADPIIPDYEGVSSETAPINQSFPDTVSNTKTGVSLSRKELDGGIDHINLEFSPYPSSLKNLPLSKYPIYLVATYNPETDESYRIELTIEFQSDARFRDGSRVLDLPSIFHDYSIDRLIIEQQNNMAKKIYEELKFPIVYSNKDYIVFSVQK
jgi:hypothetical protein